MLPDSNSVIAVIGLGNVGLPLAVEFGIKFRTVGLDVSKAQEEDSVPVLEPLSAMQEIAGVQLTIEETARRQKGPVRLVADASTIRCVLGWAPRFDDLRAISETADRWVHNRQQRGLGPRKRFGAA